MRSMDALENEEKYKKMLHVADCVRGMREHLADESVALVLADPPYNISVRGEAWDSMSASEARRFCLEWLGEAARILRPGGSLLVWGSPCTTDWMRLIVAAVDDVGLRLVQTMTWVYTQGADGRLRTMTKYATRHELVAWLAKPGPTTFNPTDVAVQYTALERSVALSKGKGRVRPDSLEVGRPPRSWIDVPRENSRSRQRRFGSHPCMKPLPLCDRLILAHSNRDDLVVVPFAGSGSEMISCIRLRRRCVGFESNSEYAAIATARLHETYLSAPS